MVNRIKEFIEFYLKEMEIEFSCKGLSAQEYFEQYGIDEQLKNKTSCEFNYSGDYLEFILKRSFELGYLTNPDESVLLQVEKDLQAEIDKGSFNKYNGPIAESSADLD